MIRKLPVTSFLTASLALGLPGNERLRALCFSIWEITEIIKLPG